MQKNLLSTFPASVVAVLFLTMVCGCWTADAKGDEGVPSIQKGTPIIEKPVKVTMEKVSRDFPDFEMEVRYGHRVFSISTFILGVNSLREAISFQRKHTRWEGPYLLVRTECGGANAWRCNKDVIFMLRGGELVRLGEVFGGSRDGQYRSYEKGCFWDIYDKFEENDLTDHVTAPFFWLALDERGGRLRPNLLRTWTRNVDHYKKNRARIEAILMNNRAGSSSTRRLEEMILSNAVLAKYCERKAEASEMEKLAKACLPEKPLNLLREIVGQVIPGEYPLTESTIQ